MDGQIDLPNLTVISSCHINTLKMNKMKWNDYTYMILFLCICFLFNGADIQSTFAYNCSARHWQNYFHCACELTLERNIQTYSKCWACFCPLLYHFFVEELFLGKRSISTYPAKGSLPLCLSNKEKWSISRGSCVIWKAFESSLKAFPLPQVFILSTIEQSDQVFLPPPHPPPGIMEFNWVATGSDCEHVPFHFVAKTQQEWKLQNKHNYMQIIWLWFVFCFVFFKWISLTSQYIHVILG